MRAASLAGFLFPLAPALAAQPQPSLLSFGVGITQAAQRNPAESPYAYSGFGPTLSLGYTRRTASSVLSGSLDGAVASLHSSITDGSTPNAFLLDGTLALDGLHTIGSGAGAVAWMLGAGVSVHGSATDHRFAESAGDDVFGFLHVGIGPTLRTRYVFGGRTITNDLAVPLVNWVDFPYSNAKAAGPRVDLTFAPPSSLRAVTDAIRYHARDGGARGVTWTYRLSYFSYRRETRRRAARQSLDVAWNVPVGRRGP